VGQSGGRPYRIREIDTGDRRNLRRFVRLAGELQRSEPLFVPVTERDLRKFLADQSAVHDGIEQALYVLSRNGRDVARCAGFLNRRWQEHHGEAAGFIGCLAAVPGIEPGIIELLDRAEEWLGSRGATRVIAGYSGSIFAEAIGFRTAHFDESPIFPYGWTPPYYADYMRAAGYQSGYPWWHFTIDFSSEKYLEVSRRATREAQCTVRFADKPRWSEELETFVRLWNEGFRDEWEFHPYSPEEFQEFFGPLKQSLAQQTLFAEVDGEPVGICSGVQDLNPLFRRQRGKFGPLGIMRFMLASRRFHRAGLWCIALVAGQRGKRIGQTLASALYQRYEQRGLAGSEYGIVNDSNLASRGLAESLGGQGRVLYHNFDKRLD
jgi:ribosomal protein S18 acetylase RimI-like enzyme